MRIRFLAALLALGALAGLGPLDRLTGDERPAEAVGGAVIDGDRVGFSPGASILSSSSSDLGRELDLLAATGAEWLRLDFAWASMQPAPDRFDWTVTDRIVAAANARGIRVLGLVGYAPGWVGGPSSPQAPGAYAAFLTAVVGRYAPLGVRHWELWNEPNLPSFWGGTVDPEGYTRLLRAGYPAVKQADPTATVITAGLSPAVDGGGTLSPHTFLTRMYAAGARGSFDAVGSHPYSFPARPDDLSTIGWNQYVRLGLLHDIMAVNGDGAKQIWLTEYGAPTGGDGAVSPARQAELLVAGLAAADEPWMGPIFLYGLRDAGTNTADREHTFGIVDRAFGDKVSRLAVADAIADDDEASPQPQWGWIRFNWPQLSARRTLTVVPSGTATAAAAVPPVYSGDAPTDGIVNLPGGSYSVQLEQLGAGWWTVGRQDVQVPAGGEAAPCAGPRC